LNKTDNGFMMTNFDWKDKVILIVEDDYVSYRLICFYLSGTCADIMWARNGREALNMCYSNPEISIALLDIQLPQINGLDVLREMKSFRTGLPVIVQTAYCMTENRRESFDAGCDEFIAKPYDRKDLLKLVGVFLN
jgi:CheY-like chemotaxis protein